MVSIDGTIDLPSFLNLSKNRNYVARNVLVQSFMEPPYFSFWQPCGRVKMTKDFEESQ